MAVRHASAEEFDARLGEIRRSPADDGIVALIVRRPAVDVRETLEEATLDVEQGVVGDGWRTRGSRRTAEGSAHPGMQVAVMNARVAEAVAGERERWALAGDQLYVDLDLSRENLPPGTRLRLGTAELEVTDELHTGCAKFTARFGPAAIRFVNGPAGRALRLRGMYARVVVPGIVRRGDAVRKA